MIILEHQLLGDELESVELMSVLSAVATRSDGLDDELIQALGTGERRADVGARSHAEGGGEKAVNARGYPQPNQ